MESKKFQFSATSKETGKEVKGSLIEFNDQTSFIFSGYPVEKNRCYLGILSDELVEVEKDSVKLISENEKTEDC